jgi:hypothetical protein
VNRRGFFKFLGIGVAGIALEQAIPLGRVWSFPSKIVIPEFLSNGIIGRCFGFDVYDEEFAKPFKIGTTIRIRLPQRFIVRDYIGDFNQPEKYKTVTLLKPGDRVSIDNVNIEN